jgi:hypothetical protein
VVTSYDAIDDAELAAYDERGLMIVRGAYAADEVEVAQRELKTMTKAERAAAAGLARGRHRPGRRARRIDPSTGARTSILNVVLTHSAMDIPREFTM